MLTPHKCKILMVEDEPTTVALAKRVLKNEGYKDIDIADRVSDAKLILRKKRPDLILLDWRLPGEDGIELLDYISENKIDTKVVMLTINDDRPSVERAILAGCVGYIVKPFNAQTLLDKVSEALNT